MFIAHTPQLGEIFLPFLCGSGEGTSPFPCDLGLANENVLPPDHSEVQASKRICDPRWSRVRLDTSLPEKDRYFLFLFGKQSE